MLILDFVRDANKKTNLTYLTFFRRTCLEIMCSKVIEKKTTQWLFYFSRGIRTTRMNFFMEKHQHNRSHLSCFSCGTSETPQWRKSYVDPSIILCNSCGLVCNRYPKNPAISKKHAKIPSHVCIDCNGVSRISNFKYPNELPMECCKNCQKYYIHANNFCVCVCQLPPPPQ